MVSLLTLLACTWISPEERAERRDQDGDGFVSTQWGGSDCDDADPEIRPDQDEVCDGVDQDCDGLIDELESGGVLAFVDLDGDGYGAAEILVCEDAVAHYAAQGGDCADDDAARNPGAQETCAPGDEDCDGLINEADDSLDQSTGYSGYPDSDGDGYGVAPELFSCEDSSLANKPGDCDDASTAVNPGQLEDCETERDEDCDGYGDCEVEVPASWTLSGPLGGLDIGETLVATDVDKDGRADLILGLPSDNRVGLLWGPALDQSEFSQSFSGTELGTALTTEIGWTSGQAAVLAGGADSAVLFLEELQSTRLQISGPGATGFGASVALLRGQRLAAVSDAGAGGGETAVYLFDGLRTGSIDSAQTEGTLRLKSSDRGTGPLVALDHDGDGQEELAVAVTTDSQDKGQWVMVYAPWTETLDRDDDGIELKDGEDPVEALGAGDFDGDGYADLAIGMPEKGAGGKGEVYVFLGPIQSGNLDQEDRKLKGKSGGDGVGLQILAYPSVTQDLVYIRGEGGAWLFELDGGDQDTKDAVWSATGTPSSTAVGDFDGDGASDLALGYTSGAGSVLFLSAAALHL